MAALVLALFLVACNRVGNDSNGTGTPDPTGTAATATPAGDVTQGVTPGGKPTGEPETTPTADSGGVAGVRAVQAYGDPGAFGDDGHARARQ